MLFDLSSDSGEHYRSQTHARTPLLTALSLAEDWHSDNGSPQWRRVAALTSVTSLRASYSGRRSPDRTPSSTRSPANKVEHLPHPCDPAFGASTAHPASPRNHISRIFGPLHPSHQSQHQRLRPSRSRSSHPGLRRTSRLDTLHSSLPRFATAVHSQLARPFLVDDERRRTSFAATWHARIPDRESFSWRQSTANICVS